jgi:ABC-type polysaccharide/polyol phosphate transport system ATPase subunit
VSAPARSDQVHSIEVEHVTKTFRRHHDRATSLKQWVTGGRRRNYDDFVALDDVSFNVRRGEVFGIIGHNGSGKSTMLKCMAGIIRANSGDVRVYDRMSALLELGAGFHPELTGRENVFLNAALLGMTRGEIAERYDAIVEFSGLDAEFLDTPVKTYSSGMYVRLAFSIAINVEPDLLIIDEILAVGDIDFQRKCTERFLEFRNSGRTTVLVTHDLTSVRTMCDRAVWLDHGKLRGTGDPGEIVDGYTESMTGATTRDVSLGTYREGTGEIQFTHVGMSVDGEPTTRVRTGDDIDIRLDLSASVPVDDPAVSITISTASGINLSDPSTVDAGVELGTVSGTRALFVRLADVSLLAGEYHLHCTISDSRRQHVFDRVHTAIAFDVMAGSPFEQQGAVTLRPMWSGI